MKINSDYQDFLIRIAGIESFYERIERYRQGAAGDPQSEIYVFDVEGEIILARYDKGEGVSEIAIPRAIYMDISKTIRRASLNPREKENWKRRADS